ncbi:MAG: hypothetical protein EXR86_12665 [Gammaproteobacteria bacterium]|nr:hypothetical protein [Gammaproteobacteria bacterium]
MQDDLSSDSEPDLPTKRCSVCGSEFLCGADLDHCWCQALPALDATQIEIGLDCRCPSCLAATLDDPA